MSQLELVADMLTFPTSVAFAADGAPLVAEPGAGVGGRAVRRSRAAGGAKR
jgi:hypothetical protein